VEKVENHTWHLFVIKTEYRDQLQAYMAEKGIQTLIHYPIPPHKQHSYEDWNELSFPIAERFSREVLSLPMSPVLKESDLEFVIQSLNSFTR
jgi:dTDP-4-amino-4,6-dideoxygalactose transaminase